MQKSLQLASGLESYGKGPTSGMSGEIGYTTHQARGNAFNMPQASRFPAVETGGGHLQQKQDFMHLRTNNRSGLHSLDRNRGGAAKNRGGGFLPQTNSTTRKDSRLNYNSSSIPYLNKRGSQQENGLSMNSRENQASGQRPRGYAPITVGGP